jgi:hypothetical protein
MIESNIHKFITSDRTTKNTAANSPSLIPPSANTVSCAGEAASKSAHSRAKNFDQCVPKILKVQGTPYCEFAVIS